MACYRSPSKTLWRVIILYQFAQMALSKSRFAGVENPFEKSPVAKCIQNPTFRKPMNSDIDVRCGSDRVYLSITMCPIYFNGYNETLLSLNSHFKLSECKGYPDWDANPPVLRFNISITEKAIEDCGSSLMVFDEPGSGIFAFFSRVQYINISGTISSHDPSNGTITYFQDVLYMFSCRYPLQYLINNTKMNVTGVMLAVKDTNGSFWSTLDMKMYADELYQTALMMPIFLKTRVFVQVKASNLTDRFHVLLDRCYATSSPLYVENMFHDLFVGCNYDDQIIMDINGENQFARFSFETFRFVFNNNRSVDTYYVHCATRLCMKDVCPSLIKNCTSRSKRSAKERDTPVSDVATVTSGPITIHMENGYLLTSNDLAKQADKTVVAVSVIAGIIGAICFTLVAFIVYNKYYAKMVPELGKTIMYPRD